MANQKEIRKRIGSVKSTQKITRAMKMVAGARLNRAQQRIQALRPYAVETGRVLARVAGSQPLGVAAEEGAYEEQAGAQAVDHPLLAHRPERNVLILVISSDRGLCGGFNSNILRAAERLWKSKEGGGKSVRLAIIGRKGRDYFQRRKAPIVDYFEGVWEDPGMGQARRVARAILRPFLAEEVDSIYLVYNEFKSAMTQMVVAEPLFPLGSVSSQEPETERESVPEWDKVREFIFEPDKEALLEVLVPMYIEITLVRALLESQASELGARMTAMDAATKNASDMIDRLTLQYNRARQAAITTELMEIIGGAEALNA